ncbi:hypothetical protein MRB53_019205 [Persea americana]|uniref:Uncharacterized protein n=1 Tax=Persea americana TaxID=3435 RepID=A0ACC2KY22_PERAE|nr:hypothetical protein MRB53_019205 [Persea americana]
MASPSTSISPRKLRFDLYNLSYQDEPTTPLVILVLASLLERIMARNERIARKCKWVSPVFAGTRIFDCDEIPDMSIQSFLERIFRYTCVSPPVFVVAYVYIDRLCQLHPHFRISSTNVHRLLITTIMVASKFLEDMNYRNSYFASVGGLTTIEMNKLEVGFLFSMGFKMHVNVSVFESYCSHLEREVSIGGGYQIERTLRLCGGEITSKKREKRELDCLARALG